MESTWARVFEGLSILMPVAMFLVIKYRFGGNPHLYAGMLACASMILWEWYMDIGPYHFRYSSEFVELWSLHGILVPAMIPFAWAWYWWLPNLILLPKIQWLDENWGRWQYLWIFLLGGVWNIAVEWPATTLTDLWTYDWKDSWTIGGVPWMNIPNGGLSTLLLYVCCRYVWTHMKGKSLREVFLLYLAAVNLAFYLNWIPFTVILGKTEKYWDVFQG